jgi:transposase
VPRPRIAMRKIRDVLRLTFGEHLSRRQVSASLGIPIATLHDHLVRAKLAGLGWPLPEDMDDTALEQALFPPTAPSSVPRPLPDWGHVHTELRKKAVTLLLLWLEYREEHPDGLGYSQFCNLYVAWRKKVDVTMRQHHKAGEKTFVDFAGMTIPIYDRRTQMVAFEAQLYVAVLGASNYTFAEAFRSQELVCWITAHVHALEYFGGCSELWVCDNLRAGVTRAHRYEPDVNVTYQEMAAHYQMAVIPTRPRRPRDKAKAEAGVLLAERWIIARLRRRRFYSLSEANAAIAECLEALNDKPFKKMPGSRRELFESLERPALRPLPPDRYQFASWKQVTVNIDYHVEFARHWYSVPYQLAGERVWVRASASTIEAFFSNKRVASHLRSYVAYKHTTDPAHMPESHRRHAKWTPSRIVAWAEKTGPASAALVAGILERRPHPEQGYRSALGIIRLAERYGTARCEAACARALQMSSFSYRSVESILAHNLDGQPLPDPTRPTSPHPHHRNVRGGAYYR